MCLIQSSAWCARRACLAVQQPLFRRLPPAVTHSRRRVRSERLLIVAVVLSVRRCPAQPPSTCRAQSCISVLRSSTNAVQVQLSASSGRSTSLSAHTCCPLTRKCERAEPRAFARQKINVFRPIQAPTPQLFLKNYF